MLNQVTTESRLSPIDKSWASADDLWVDDSDCCSGLYSASGIVLFLTKIAQHFFNFNVVQFFLTNHGASEFF